MANTLSSIELVEQLSNPELIIVDVRPMAAYNGWQLQGEARGGHIRGAVAFPLSWAADMEPAELETLFESKGLKQEKTIVVYGYSAADSAAMVQVLGDMGYPNLLIYEDGLIEWAVDDALPMARLSNFEKLVYPGWLHSQLDEVHTGKLSGRSIIIFHVDFEGHEEYKQGHITRANYLDTNRVESASSGNRRSDDELEAALLSLGIRHDTTVVLYGRDASPDPGQTSQGHKAGQLAAARVAVILMYVGVEDVRLLDGGFDAWISDGYEVETTVNEPVPVAEFGAPIPGNPGCIIDMKEAKQLLADPDSALVSIRSESEFAGQTSGYSYIEGKGRIPGAVWGNAGSDAYHMQHYRNPDNTMRAYHEIQENWRKVGVTPDKRIAFYCGTGWRASEAFFDAYLLGWDNIAVYDGGWLEWSRDESNPIERGGPRIGSRIGPIIGAEDRS
jgi:thiosulfate/3-mercaptopyruvate sulfurtransferase